MKKLGLILILIPLFAHANPEETQLAQIVVRPRMFLCQFDYPKVIDNKCEITRPISAAGEWCQCNFEGYLVDGYAIPNPSFIRWQQ